MQSLQARFATSMETLIHRDAQEAWLVTATGFSQAVQDCQWEANSLTEGVRVVEA
jgi:hypothetical protein